MLFPQNPKPNNIKITSVSPTLVSLTHSLKRQVRRRGGQRWLLEISYPPLTREQFAPIWAFSIAQQGQFKTFGYIPEIYGTTSGDATGTCLSSGIYNAGDASISVVGLTGTLKGGDFIKFAGHDKVYMAISQKPVPNVWTPNIWTPATCSDPQYTDQVSCENSSISGDVSTATYTGKSFSVTAQDTAPQCIAFNSDLSQMYITGNGSDTVYQYSLSIAGDVSTATYTGNSFSVNAQDSAPTGIAFSSDLSQMFVVGSGTDTVYQYSLSALGDVSTATYTGNSFSVNAQDTAPIGISFSSDLTQMYIVGNGSDTVYQYALSTPGDVSTATYTGNSFNTSAQDTSPIGIAFSPDLTQMYITGHTNNTVYQYALSPTNIWTPENCSDPQYTTEATCGSCSDPQYTDQVSCENSSSDMLNIEPALVESVSNSEVITYDDVPFNVAFTKDTTDMSVRVNKLVAYKITLAEII